MQLHERARAAAMWLIQANMRDQALRQTIETALDCLGEQHHAVALVPFSRELPELPFSADERWIVCMGPSFVPRVATETTWRPGIYFDPSTFRSFVRPDEDSKASSGGHFGIVEANCFNAARFYAADAETVLAAVAAHVRSHVNTRA